MSGFKQTPYRLSASATPAPNDIEELTNHADFLGIMSSQEMRSTFFIADSRGEFMKYRLKGHAAGAFYEWLASWAMNCGTKARKNSATLGLSVLVQKPCLNTRRSVTLEVNRVARKVLRATPEEMIERHFVQRGR